MKKYLLLILSMLSVSIGTWADVTVTGIGTGTITISSENAGDINTGLSTALGYGSITDTRIIVQGKVNLDDLTKIKSSTRQQWDIFTFDFSGLTEYPALNTWPKMWQGSTEYPVYILPKGCSGFDESMTTYVSNENTDNGIFNIYGDLQYIIIPASAANNPAYIYIYKRKEDKSIVTDLASEDKSYFTGNESKIEVLGLNGAGAESSWSTLITNLKANGTWGSKISVLPYSVSGCDVTINIESAEAGQTLADLIATAKAAVIAGGQTGICTLTVKGELTANDLIALGGTNMTGATRIDLSGATLGSGASIENLDVPLTLTSLVLPPNCTVSDAMALEFSACSGLNYVYSPTSDSGATVADYVWVNKAGGLAQAFENEPTLCSGIYIKVASNVALNATDMAFNSLTNKNTVYQYLDLSGANISSSTVFTNSSAASPYRVILPDNWTGDNMAEFKSRATLGDAVAALYSYNGNKLNILGLANTYSPLALSDARIVRSGTTAVEFLEGKDHNNVVQGDFTKRMLEAINGAVNTITSVKISAKNIIPTWTFNSYDYTLSFTNSNITSLDLSGIHDPDAANNNNALKLNVSSCSNLEVLNLANDVITSVDAHGCTNLKAVNLTGANISGDFNVSNSGITRITVDTRIGGTITATGCTSLNRINISGTIGGDVIANGTSGSPLTTPMTFINNGTITGDVNLSYTGLTSFTNNGPVKNINLSNCTAITTFAPAGTINGDIDLTDCTALTSINVANATINNQGSYNSGYSADINFKRSGQAEVMNSVYDNLKDGESGYNVTKASSGQTSLTIIPTVTAKTAEPASTSVAGVTEDDCALTVGITGSETLTSLLQKFYLMKNNMDVAGYADVTTAQLGTLSICNLTVTGEITAADITTINALTFNESLGAGIVWRDATLNLDGATLASGVSFATKKITNATVNNIILPRTLDKDIVNATNFGSCTNLNAAVSLNAARTQVVGYVKKPGSLRQTLSQVPDFQVNPWQYMQGLNLPSVTLTGTLLACDIATGNDHVIANGNYKQSPESSEKLTGFDSSDTDASKHVGLAFEGVSTLRNLDIADAIFVDGSDNTTIMEENMTLSQLGWAGIVSLKMPKSSQMKDVPAHFLENCKNITYVCIPYNYKTIGDAAFYLAGTNWITTTDNAGAEVDNGINTYTFSKNLEQIGINPGTDANGYPKVPANPVFGAVNSGEIHDIYFLGSDAPKCYRGAFASGMTYGWGGFDGGNVYCREKYKNGAFLFTVLNFPQGLTEEQEKKYTDITKVYTKKDQTGAVDADGKTIPWPTFSELGRSYNQAIRGLIWKDWNINEDLQEKGDINGGTINFDPTALPDGNTEVKGTPDYTQFYDYVGLHEFVLSKATYVAPDEVVDENNEIVRYYKQDDWYTFCIPFDMTEAQVAELLGVPASETRRVGEHSTVTYNNYLQAADDRGNAADKVTTAIMPQIVTLKSVLRNSSSNTVTLYCSQDLATGTYANKYYMPNATGNESAKYQSNGTVDLGEGAGDENIVIRAGYPYMIRPYVLCTSEGVPQAVAGNNLGKQVLTRYTFKEAASGISINANAHHEDCFEAIGGQKTGDPSKFAKPYENHKVQAYSDAEESEPLMHGNTGKKYNYTFIGQFWKQFLPLNSFYMSNHMWYHYTVQTTGYYWNPYLCIIMVSDENSAEADAQFRTDTNNSAEAGTTSATILPEETGVDNKGHAVFDRQMEIRYKDGLSDLFTTNAREYRFVFDDDIMEIAPDGEETTGIERLDGVDIIPANSKVYNMNGQLVGKSLNGLSKGMYIINGKKYVVK